MLNLSLSHCEIKCLTLLRSLSVFTRLITQPKLLSCKTNRLNQPRNKLKKFEILLVHRFHLVIFCSPRLNKTNNKCLHCQLLHSNLFLSHSMCDCNTTNKVIKFIFDHQGSQLGSLNLNSPPWRGSEGRPVEFIFLKYLVE